MTHKTLHMVGRTARKQVPLFHPMIRVAPNYPKPTPLMMVRRIPRKQIPMRRRF